MRLSDATLACLPPGVRRPGYDRAAVQAGIVHLGAGAFHRAHQAALADTALRAGDRRWGITGASLRSPATRDALAPQDGLYVLNLRGEADAYAVIGSIGRVLVAPEDPAVLLAAMAHPAVRIISLTVTEKAYCLDPATGTLDEAHPDIRHDLAHPHTPRSAPGFLVAALARRRAAGLPPPTVLCCDNLPRNGATLHRLLVRLGAQADPGLGAWIEGETACPDTMVDRIVPATTDADRARVAAALGMEDAWPVVAEPFLQWVIQDRFTAGRPDYEAYGATMVSDVAPFEAMKLRMLNAAHSAIAYLGLLAGDATVADAVRNPGLAAFVRGLMRDAAQTLSVPPGMDAAGYGQALMARFANPALRHLTAQIAMDGSQKLPPRLLDAMRDRLDQGLPVARHAMAVAAWMQHVAASPALQDPQAETLARAVRGGGPAALLDVAAVFGDLAARPGARAAIAAALARLQEAGPRRALLGLGDG
jgi:fructuronate reductase